jgi:hypothetical protein
MGVLHQGSEEAVQSTLQLAVGSVALSASFLPTPATEGHCPVRVINYSSMWLAN